MSTNFKVGDIVKVVFNTPAGAKTKPTPFEGIVLALRGQGPNKTFTVRKIASNKIAVEKIFPLGAPVIEKVDVLKSTRVRRAKLYYLRKK